MFSCDRNYYRTLKRKNCLYLVWYLKKLSEKQGRKYRRKGWSGSLVIATNRLRGLEQSKKHGLVYWTSRSIRWLPEAISFHSRMRHNGLGYVLQSDYYKLFRTGYRVSPEKWQLVDDACQRSHVQLWNVVPVQREPGIGNQVALLL